MNRREFGTHLAGLVVGSVLTETARAAEKFEPLPNWHTELKPAYKVAVAQQKPLLIVFGAVWCGYCHKLERETLSDREVASYISREFVPVHLDFDRNEKAAKVLEVKSIPCTIILSHEADLLGRLDGYRTASKFQRGLRETLLAQSRILQTRHQD